MVEEQLCSRDITDPRVLEAMRFVPRHEFVPDRLKNRAYEDCPLPIGHSQTISQPYIVALMTQLARPGPASRVLDVGTGCGYQAAVMARLAATVWSIEIVDELAVQAQKRLGRMGYPNIHVSCCDGFQGLIQQAPFDAIVVAAAPAHIPPPLIEQLAVGGRLVIPVGGSRQCLTVVEKRPDGTVQTEEIAPVVFVPMTGAAREAPQHGQH